MSISAGIAYKVIIEHNLDYSRERPELQNHIHSKTKRQIVEGENQHE